MTVWSLPSITEGGWLRSGALLRAILMMLLAVASYTGIGVAIPSAAAQSSWPCYASSVPCDQGMAYEACMTHPYKLSTMLSVTRRQCVLTGPFSQGDGYYNLRVWGPTATSNGQDIGPASATNPFNFRGTCAKREAYTGAGPWSSGGKARNGSMGCQKGCDGVWYSNSDGSMTFNTTGDTCKEDEKGTCEHMGEGFYWNALLKVCEPPEGKCPGNSKANSLGQCEPEPCPDGKVLQHDGTCKTKDSECPAGNIKSPDGKCLPGEGQCAQGEARGKDGTCKKDSDGDGQPDEENGEPGEKEPDSFSGGDDCKTPPSCSGSMIMCGQARIMWRIDCNTRKNRNIAGGQCNTPPICTGEKCDALEYSGLLMQWRTACALEKMSSATGGNNGDGIKEHMTAMKQAEVNALRALSKDEGHDGITPDMLWGKPDVNEKINEGLFGGGGGSCDLSFTIGGYLVSPPAQFWRIIQIIHWLMVASAYLWVAIKLSK